MDYEEMYYKLFHAITEALEYLNENDIPKAILCLAQAQMDSVEPYL